ncbi:MAG: hypothetical protein NTW19_16110 [Planctomycetota bacterium]|nr:hypothetical protein [Planctomycetota bacterium]
MPPTLQRIPWPGMLSRLAAARIRVIDDGPTWNVQFVDAKPNAIRTPLDAVAAAGRLAEMGVAPLHLVPCPDWESQRAGPSGRAWSEALALLGKNDTATSLTGRTALLLPARRTPLPQLIERLAAGDAGTAAFLFADAPLWLEIRGQRGATWHAADKK